MQIFHIKSQSNYLTSWESLLFALILHPDWQCDQRSEANSWPLQAKQRRRDDRPVTLSQIVHLTLRCMFDLDANFEKQRRLIAHASILKPLCVVHGWSSRSALHNGEEWGDEGQR
jgi:hypothetical protein